MLCLRADDAVGLKSWPETAYFLLAVLFVTTLHIALFIMDLGIPGLLFFLDNFKTSWLEAKPSQPDSLPWPPPQAPHILCFLCRWHCLALHLPVRQQRKQIFFLSEFSSVAALLLKSYHVNHQSEGGLWVNLILNLN